MDLVLSSPRRGTNDPVCCDLTVFSIRGAARRPPVTVPVAAYNGLQMTQTTRLLKAAGKGAPHAAAELLPVVYQELRRLARAQMAQERAGHTLQATALVHDAYLRLVQDAPVRWEGRRHFFAAAAEAMRRILIEHARRKHALKNGGQRHRVELHDDARPIPSPCDMLDEVLALNEALEKLSKEDSGKAELVKLLYFAGLNLDEAAAALGISRTTAHRQWVFARAWLYDAMNGGGRRDAALIPAEGETAVLSHR